MNRRDFFRGGAAAAALAALGSVERFLVSTYGEPPKMATFYVPTFGDQVRWLALALPAAYLPEGI